MDAAGVRGRGEVPRDDEVVRARPRAVDVSRAGIGGRGATEDISMVG